MGYEKVKIDSRNEFYKNHYIILAQCTCKKAVHRKIPIEYCRNNHDLYVNHNGTFHLSRLTNNIIDLKEDLKENNITKIKEKMIVAKLRVSKEICNNLKN